MEYVRGSSTDKWHWCKNCTQYPDLYVCQKTSSRPSSNLCEQCRIKEHNGNCLCEGLNTTEEAQLEEEISVFSDSGFEDQSYESEVGETLDE